MVSFERYGEQMVVQITVPHVHVRVLCGRRKKRCGYILRVYLYSQVQLFLFVWPIYNIHSQSERNDT